MNIVPGFLVFVCFRIFRQCASKFMEKIGPKKNSNEASKRFIGTFFVCSPFDVKNLIRTIYLCMMTITLANDFMGLMKRR